MLLEFTPSGRPSPNPLRVFAAAAVAATEQSRVQAVLRRRLATQLAIALREYIGKPTASLDLLPPNEAAWCLAQAGVLVAIAESVATTAPPTAGELLRVDADRALQLVQAQVRCMATRNGHRLGSFRPTPGAAGYLEAACDWCHAGVSVHTLTAEASAAELLTHPCPR